MQSSIFKSPRHCSSHTHSDGITNKQLYQKLNQAIQQRNYPRAMRLLNYCITQDPKNPTHYTNRGLIYYHYRNWSQAMADYNQALQLNPYADRAYARRAKCNAALKLWSEAIADYDVAIDLNPYNINARIAQGVLFRTLKMYEDAIICFGLALFVGKLSADVYAERGRTYHLGGQWNCAIGDYQRALDMLTESPRLTLQTQIQTWISELIG